jgi:hypothetical protein
MSIRISDNTGKPTATSDKQLIHANQLKAKVGHLQNGEELRRDNGAPRSHNQLDKTPGQQITFGVRACREDGQLPEPLVRQQIAETTVHNQLTLQLKASPVFPDARKFINFFVIPSSCN